MTGTAVLLVVWSLLLASFDGACAGITEARGLPSDGGRPGISDETLTDWTGRDACGRMISLLRPGEIRYDRSLFAEGDTTMGVSPDPLKDQACEKSDDPLDRGRIGGDVRIRDWPGIGRDTAYFFGYQFVVVGLLYALPESVTGWTKEQKEEYDFDRWVKNVNNPQWDEDKWYLNYLVHPYWGAVYYVRARERGFDKLESFFYSAFLSALFEYGVEALFERPSYQDLIVTPIGGTLVGMYVFEPIREKIKAKGAQQEWYDKLALVLTDPLGALSGLTDRMLGVKSSVRIAHSAPGKQRCKPAERDAPRPEMTMSSTSCRSPYTGIEMTLQW